jgi:hypothetical protein
MPRGSGGIQGGLPVPRVDHDCRVTGLREHLAGKCAELLARFVESDGELFPYRGAEIKRLQQRLDDLNARRDLLVYRFELGDYAPPREDGQHIYTIRGDRLVTAEYEHAVLS